jgi:hypothetical protein
MACTQAARQRASSTPDATDMPRRGSPCCLPPPRHAPAGFLAPPARQGAPTG